jgi:hypothetical protein
MKLVFSLYYSKDEENFGYDDGGISYGHRLQAPGIQLRNKLENAGYEVLTARECPLHNADLVIFHDLDEKIYHNALSLPKEIPCVLISMESPIYTPFSHMSQVLFSKRWSAVMTWNRAFSSKNIYYFDIPIAGVGESDEIRTGPKKPKGVVVSSLKKDYLLRGLTRKRDLLLKQLASEGYLDVYGMNWPNNIRKGLFGSSSHKIQTMSNYEYAFISENSIFAGYVTEKLADAILAGIPSIYYGDSVNAKRRFPGTFVPLKELTLESFLEARDLLYRNYPALLENVKKCRLASGSWMDSYLNTFFLMLDNLDK